MIIFQLLFTSEYLELQRYKSLSSNNKVYYGPSIPSMFIDANAATSVIKPESGKKVCKKFISFFLYI